MVETVTINTALSFLSVALISMIGFYIKQLGNKLDKMQSKEMCEVFRISHDDKHIQLEKDVDNIAKIARNK